MKDRIIDAVGGIDDDMIESTDALRRKKRTRPAIKWGAMAACFCLVAAGAFALLRGGQDVNTVQSWKEGYTAGDYFRFCVSDGADSASSQSKADESCLPYAETRSFSDARVELEREGVIPEMETHPLVSFQARYKDDGSLYCVELMWMRRNAEGLKDYSDLTVTAGYEEVQRIDDCIAIELDEHGKVVEPAVTVTERDGVRIVARGGERTEKTLTFQSENGWYQISGSWNDSYEPVAALLDWFWEHPVDFARFPMEAGDEYTTAPLSEVPEAFADILPDFAAFGFTEESSVVVLKNGVPVHFEGCYVAHADAEKVKEQTYYDTEGYTLMHWCVLAEPDVYDLAKCRGELDTLTEEQVRGILENDNRLSFMQDGLLIIVYPDDAREAWELIGSLQ